MKQFNHPKGKLGEEIAKRHLKQKGFKVLKENFRTRYGEIDLICLDKKTLVFIEVKLKVGEDFGTPEEMITPTKVFQVKRTAQAFLQKNPQLEKNYPLFRVDAVAIVLDGGKFPEKVKHYQNIDF